MTHHTPLFDLLILINNFFDQHPEYVPAINELFLSLAEQRAPQMPIGCDWVIWRRVMDAWREVNG